VEENVKTKASKSREAALEKDRRDNEEAESEDFWFDDDIGSNNSGLLLQ